MGATTPVTLTIGGQNEFDLRVHSTVDGPLDAQSLDTVQVNIGLTCDLACRHCHVESSPRRTEQMTWDTMEAVIALARGCGAHTIDITGGAPEMNPHFRRFVTSVRNEGFDVTVRTNLTIMLHEGFADMPAFYRDHGVHLVASLPCYLPENVNRQRGVQVYERSVEVMQRLNRLGFGIDPTLPLDLVYNPQGPSLPPEQAGLERDYRRELEHRFGIRFTTLYAITNMPIGRFLHDLRRDGHDESYDRLLRDSFNAETLDGLMCRHQIHVSWDGALHDCDFNYALGMPVGNEQALNVRDVDVAWLRRRAIATGTHCFGCTAGHGSSCTGTLA